MMLEATEETISATLCNFNLVLFGLKVFTSDRDSRVFVSWHKIERVTFVNVFNRRLKNSLSHRMVFVSFSTKLHFF